MNANYTSRPFANDETGTPARETTAGAILRGTSALGGGVAFTALLAALLVH